MLKVNIVDDDDEADLATLSEISYARNDNEKEQNALKLGYTIDRDLSNYNHSVFKKGNKVVLAFRGTNPTNLDDLAADFNIALGQRSHHRFSDAEKISREVEKKYGSDFTVTGHSLGGTLALHVNQMHGKKAKVFNPGSSPVFERDYIPTPGAEPVILRNDTDLVSAGHRKRKEVQVVNDESNSWLKNAMNQTWSGFFLNQLQAHGLTQFKNKRAKRNR